MRILGLLLLAWIGAGAAEPALACPEPSIAAGDAAWARRAEGASEDGRAQAAPVGAAIDAFASAIAEAPDCLGAYARLLEALYFAGDYASADAGERRARFDRAAEVVDAALAEIARRAGDPEDARAAFDPARLRDLPDDARRTVARIHFWSAVDLAAWAREHGVFAAVRAGVAGRVRDHAEASLALDPGYEAGGAHRVLAALHGELPRVPLLTPWVDPARALPEVETAAAIAPAHPSNRLMLGLVLLDREPARRDEAITLLEGVATLEPDPQRRVEDAALRELARARLAKEGVSP